MATLSAASVRSSLRHVRQAFTRPHLFRPIARRGYASVGTKKINPLEEALWAAGSIAVTIPSCWYLLSNHKSHSSHHGDHENTEENTDDQIEEEESIGPEHNNEQTDKIEDNEIEEMSSSSIEDRKTCHCDNENNELSDTENRGVGTEKINHTTTDPKPDGDLNTQSVDEETVSITDNGIHKNASSSISSTKAEGTAESA